MLIYYTTEEGGLWTPLEVPHDEKMLKDTLIAYWDEQIKLSAFAVGVKWILAHAVLFPSSEVWDSYYGRIRGTDEPNYYKIVQEALGGAT